MANASPGSPAFSSVSVPVAYPGTGVQLVAPPNLPYNAVGTVAIGGTVGTGNTVTATVNGSASTATALAADTPALLASRLVTAINANAAVNALVSASAAGSVVTITSTVTGTTGYYSLSTSATGGATATASYTTLEMPGIVFPIKGFSYATPGGSGAITFYAGTPSFVDAATKADLRTQGLV